MGRLLEKGRVGSLLEMERGGVTVKEAEEGGGEVREKG